MKTLGKLKLLGLGALLLVGMSSCLKSNDPGFGFLGITAYIEQTGTGDGARFMPAIQIQANEPMKNAVAKYNEVPFYFVSIDGTSGTVMELNPVFNNSADTVQNGYFTITATNAENEGASTQVGFSGDKKLGAIHVSEFTYKSAGRVSAKWNKVENAEHYYLVYKTSNYMWLPYIELSPNTTGEGEEMSYSFDLTLVKGQKYKLAIAASYKSLLIVGEPLTVTGGEDASLFPESQE